MATAQTPPRDADDFTPINQDTFNQYDYDGNGNLDGEEFGSYAQHETSLNPYQAQGRFTLMDADGSGGLSFQEFDGGVCCA